MIITGVKNTKIEKLNIPNNDYQIQLILHREKTRTGSLQIQRQIWSLAEWSYEITYKVKAENIIPFMMIGYYNSDWLKVILVAYLIFRKMT